MDDKLKIIHAGDYSRIVQLPVVVSEELLTMVGDTEGVLIETVKQAGRTEIYYEIDIDYPVQLVDENVKFFIEESMKILA